MLEDKNENSNSNHEGSNSDSEQQNPPLRDTNTYLEKGEKSGITRKE